MPRGETLAVHGIRDVLKGFADAEKQERAALRTILKTTGQAVQTETAGRIAPLSAKSAAGFKTGVRQRGVTVYQSLRKTTGLHPEYGAKQMRILIGAMYDKQTETMLAMERAMDEIARRFNR